MLLTAVAELVLGLMEMFFSWVKVPTAPLIIMDTIVTYLGYIQQGLGIVWLIVPKEVVVILLPFILVVKNFHKLYCMTLWALRKIPLLNID